MNNFIVRINGQRMIDENVWLTTAQQAKSLVDWLKNNKVDAEFMSLQLWKDKKKEANE